LCPKDFGQVFFVKVIRKFDNAVGFIKFSNFKKLNSETSYTITLREKMV